MADQNENKDQELRDLLDRLNSELEQSESVDERGQEMLRNIDADIRRRLEEKEAKRETEENDSVPERLQRAIEHFEETHPTLTLTLSEMMTILSNAGI
jgi:hypothetical protein